MASSWFLNTQQLSELDKCIKDYRKINKRHRIRRKLTFKDSSSVSTVNSNNSSVISISSDTNDESEDFNKINISTDIDEPKSPPVPVLKPLPLTDNVLIKKKQFNYDRRYSNSDSDSDFDHVGRLEVLQSKAVTDNVLIRKKSSVVARTYKTPVAKSQEKVLQQLKLICDSDTEESVLEAEKTKVENDENVDKNDRDQQEDYCFDNKQIGDNELLNGLDHLTLEDNELPSNDIGNQNYNDDKKFSFLESLSSYVPDDRCNPNAKYYRDKYKSEKTKLARKLYDLYNKKVFDNQLDNFMVIEWNQRIRGSAGYCQLRRDSKNRYCKIILSNKVVDTADRLRDTLIHEMCHAAVWLIDKKGEGHGPYWKQWTMKAMSVFPELPEITRCHDFAVLTKYTYKCEKCGQSVGRHSKSIDVTAKRCGICFGKLVILLNKKTKNGIISTPITERKLNTFAQFVKENYSEVKKTNPNHAIVMRILSQQFSEQKITNQCNSNE